MSSTAESKIPVIAVCWGLVAFFCAFAVYWVPPQRRGWNTVSVTWNAVPLGNDASSYLDLAVQVAKGHGLSVNANDPTLGALLASAGQPSAGEIDAGPAVPSTRRPPLFSMLLAGGFRMWGFDIGLAHILNCALMAATCALLVIVLFRRHGWGPALIFFMLFVVVDVRTRDHARLVMTEPLASLLVTIAAIVLIMNIEARPLWASITAGISWGLALLTRGIFALWLPGLLLLVIWLSGSLRSRSVSLRLCSACAFLVAALAVAMPWFVHNSRALGSFMPLGSSMIGLPSGFSEEAWAAGGVWTPRRSDYFAGVSDPRDPPTVVARKQAIYGRRQALQWIRANPGRTAVLGVRKAMSIWVPDRSVAMTFLIFPVLGFLALRRSTDSRVIGSFLILNTLAVAGTWTFQGDRFQVPMLGLLHYAAAIGLWSVACSVSQAGRFNVRARKH